MRRLILLLLCSALALALAVAGVDSIYREKNPAAPEEWEKYRDIPDGLRVCNLGSSHAMMALYYESATDLPAFNFALTAQYASYDLRVLRHYREKIAPGAVVLLDLSYFSLFGVPDTETTGFREKNQRYYHILSPWEVREFSLGDAATAWLPSLKAYQDLLPALLGPAREPPVVYNTWEQRVAADDPNLPGEAAGAACRHLITEKLDGNGVRIVNREEVDALCALIAYCRELDATPVLIVTPLLSEYLREAEMQAPEFAAQFDALVGKILDDTGVKYYDYSHDPRFIDQPRLFANSDHLNKAGAEAFTAIVMEEVVNPILTEERA